MDREGTRFINRLSNSTFQALQSNYHELTLKTALTFQHIQCAQEKQLTLEVCSVLLNFSPSYLKPVSSLQERFLLPLMKCYLF